MDIMFAISLAGHDKGQVYFVSKLDNQYVYLVNGTTKLLDSPKKKKLIHVQLIKRIPGTVLDIIAGKDVYDDLLINKLLNAYSVERQDIIY